MPPSPGQYIFPEGHLRWMAEIHVAPPEKPNGMIRSPNVNTNKRGFIPIYVGGARLADSLASAVCMVGWCFVFRGYLLSTYLLKKNQKKNQEQAHGFPGSPWFPWKPLVSLEAPGFPGSPWVCHSSHGRFRCPLVPHGGCFEHEVLLPQLPWRRARSLRSGRVFLGWCFHLLKSLLNK